MRVRLRGSPSDAARVPAAALSAAGSGPAACTLPPRRRHADRWQPQQPGKGFAFRCRMFLLFKLNGCRPPNCVGCGSGNGHAMWQLQQRQPLQVLQVLQVQLVLLQRA